MNSEIKDDFNKQIEEAAEIDRKKKELAAKELILKERRVSNSLAILEENDKHLELAKSINFGITSAEDIAGVQKESTEYMQAAKNKMMFINESFDGVIPYFRKNLILIGGKTGEGKSTTVANIISSTMRQASTKTGNRCKVLVITNEEKREDVYNRVTCLAKGWSYTNHDKFTEEQINTLSEYIGHLSKDGWLNVIDDSYGSTKEISMRGMTTSIEGIQMIFDNMIRDGTHYDVVLIDYYQNINYSKKNSQLVGWQVQEQLAGILDQYKNVYPAPIILLAQVSPPDKENKTPFKVRIEGRKSILNVSTTCLEMVADRENLRTEWIVHKSRFSEAVGISFYTGYDKGRFVKWNEEFRAQVEKIKEMREVRNLDKKIGIKSKEEEDE